MKKCDGFDMRLAKYMEVVHGLNQQYYKDFGFTEDVCGSIAVSAKDGSKLTKVMVGKRIHTFIDQSNGDILKAATWKAPAKNGVRGNIFSLDCGASVITHFGARYLK